MDLEVSQKINEFFDKYKHQTYKQGEILVRADENPSGVFFLKKGIVKEYTISKKGEEIVINIFKPLAFFPMSWAMNNTDNKYYFEAMSELTLCKAPKADVIQFIKSNPDVLYDLLSRVYKGTDGIISRMVSLMAEDAYDRMIVELLIHAKRFGKHLATSKAIEIQVSEHDLAERTGLTRETISREIKKLKENQLLTFNKGVITINDIQKLENEIF